MVGWIEVRVADPWTPSATASTQEFAALDASRLRSVLYVSWTVTTKV